MYATYEQYKSIGGKLTEDEFSDVYTESKYKLENWTQGRVAAFEPDYVDSPDWVVYAIKVIADSVFAATSTVSSFTSLATDGDTLSSYSNGVESFSFATASAEQASEQAKVLEQSAYRKVVEAAPIEYITWAVS